MSSPYHLAKRSVTLSPSSLTVIVAISCGIVVLNVVLLWTCCTVRRRKKARQFPQVALQPNDGSGQNASFIESTPHLVPSESFPRNAPNYKQKMISLRMPDTPLFVSPPPPIHTPSASPRRAGLENPRTMYKADGIEENQIDGCSPGTSSSTTNQYQYIYVPHDIRRDASIRRSGSLHRSNSTDTASIYSAASAPIDAHEGLFQSMLFDPAPLSAPAWTGYPNDLQLQQAEARSAVRASMVVREEPGPDAYLKPRRQWNPQSQRRSQPRRKAQPARTPVPPVPELPHYLAPRLPPAVLRSHPNFSLPEPASLQRDQSDANIHVRFPPGLEHPIPPTDLKSRRPSKNPLPFTTIIIPPSPTEFPTGTSFRPTTRDEVMIERERTSSPQVVGRI